MPHVIRHFRAAASLMALAAALLALPGVAHADAKPPVDDIELRVRVDNYFTMRLAAIDGKWQPVTLARPSFNHIAIGYVTASQGNAEKFSVSMQLRLDGGARSRGHRFYDMTFQRQSDGTYKGTHTVQQGTSTNQGAVMAEVLPPQPYTAKGHDEIDAGEYPRLLLRKSDIPALRAKLKTPLGEALLAKTKDVKDPVVLGLLYQATGDARHAREAMRIIQGYSDIDGNAGLTGNVGHSIVRVVLAADLCYDGWPEEYRDKLLRHIKARLPKRQYDLLIPHANYNQVSNYYGPAFGSAAIASLLLHRSKGPAPAEPVKPLSVRYADCKLPPLKDYNPPQGVPIVPLVSDELPKDWIYAGGFKPEDGQDLLAPLGGPEKARPTTSDEITDGKKTLKFKLVSHEKDMGYFNWLDRDVIDITNAIGRIYHTQSFFYTVVKVDKPGWYEFAIGTDHKESWTYLNGVLIEEGHVMQLDKGLYSILIKVNIGQTEPWGREMLAVRFTHLPDGQKKKTNVKEINTEIRAEYEQAMAFWKTEMAQWKARDGEDLECLRMFHKGREQMYQHMRYGIGDGGFQAEATHYGNIAAYYPLFYATLYRKAIGRDLSPFPDATHVLPRQMMQGCFHSSRPAFMNLNVKAHFSADWCANNFPVVPDKWKPFILWGWNKVMSVEPASATTIDRARADAILSQVNGRTLAATFINYPLDLAPQHPSEGMPKTWQADTLGHYVFRSGWEGKDEFIAQVFTKSIPIRAWSHPNAGAFRLWGLGHRWTTAPIERSGYRPEESIVLLPDNVHHESACGIVTHHDAEADGSGALSISMHDVYMAVPEPKKKPTIDRTIDDLEGSLKGGPPDIDGEKLRKSIVDSEGHKAVKEFYQEHDRGRMRKKLPKLYSWFNERFEEAQQYKSHIDGERAFAFDYSGKSGAPCLMVMVDNVRGGQLKQWLWHLPKSENIKAHAEGKSFTISYPDATLRGTFISPADIKPQFMKDQTMTFIYRGGSSKGQMETRSFDFIAAQTKAKDAVLFVIITVQRGTPPEVKATGSGTGAVATVGQRKISYRDGKIIIE